MLLSGDSPHPVIRDGLILRFHASWMANAIKKGLVNHMNATAARRNSAPGASALALVGCRGQTDGWPWGERAEEGIGERRARAVAFHPRPEATCHASQRHRGSVLLTFVLVAVLMALAACASGGGAKAPFIFYPGNRLPRDQVALLGSQNCGDSLLDVRLLDINGKPGPNKFGYGNDWDGGFCVELAPGTYRLMVRYVHLEVLSRRKVHSLKDLKVTFAALPGHQYLLDAVVVENTWLPRILDAKTGEVAGSHGKPEMLCKTFAMGDPSSAPSVCQ